ncbi:MAG: zinc-ribbon domain-containing protein [Deltaproteobacteria bacterium]|nr:zinc-ribbon domain-containing protein [Deltaproteobacteria bacterium]
MPTIRCPSCQVERDIPSERLPPGRLRVRCKQCGAAFEITGAPPPPPVIPPSRTKDDDELAWVESPPPAAAAKAPPPNDSSALASEPSGHGAELERAQRPPPPAAPVTIFSGGSDAPLDLDWGDRPARNELPPAPAYEGPVPPGVPDLQAIAESTAVTSGPLARELPESLEQETTEPTGPQAAMRFGFDDLRVNQAAYPVALLLALIAKWMFLPAILLDYFRTLFHEFGHASVAWLSGRAATPLALLPGFGFASVNPDRSVVVYLCVLFLLGVATWRGIRERSRFLLVVVAMLLFFQTVLTLFVSARRFEELMLLGGAGGELVLGALVAVTFYYRLPDRLRWDFFRYPGLVAAMYAFVASSWFWVEVATGRRSVPWGSCVGGKDDAAGDMNRLHDDHGWSAEGLTALFLGLAIAGAGALVVHYAVFLAKATLKARQCREESTSPTLPSA